MRGLAHVGVIALVDEATGYQEKRARDALHKILDEFIATELRDWTKTFPDEFYKYMFKLWGWEHISFSTQRPAYVGKLTNDFVYERLAPGVLEELQRINPPRRGRRQHHHHRWLTEDVGHPKLREHIAAVMAIMRLSLDKKKFIANLNRAFPKFPESVERLQY